MHAFCSQHLCVHIGAQQYTGIAGKGGKATDALGALFLGQPVKVATVRANHGNGQERQQPLADAHRPGAGAAATVGGGEGLVQVHVDHIEAHIAGAHPSEYGVEIGAVVVQQPAGPVHPVGDFLDTALEHSQGGGVGEHDAGSLGTQRGLQCIHVHIAIGFGGNFPRLVTAHDGRGRVGAVGRIGYEDLGTSGVVPGIMIGAYHGDAGELPLSPGHGRQRNCGHAGDFLEDFLQFHTWRS